jgi:PAS domain-containing protein
MADAEGKVVDINQAFENILGYSRDEIIGRKVYFFEEKENKDKGDDKTEEKDDNKMENLAVEENGGVNENEIKDVKQNNNPNTKTCNLCGYEKPLSDFSPGKYTCKKCRTDKRQYGTVATKEEDKQIREFLSEDKEVEFECEYSNEIITQIKEHVNNFLDNIKPITFLKTDISNMNENEKEEMKKVLNKLETKINSLKNENKTKK